MSVRRLAEEQPESFAFSKASEEKVAFWMNKYPEDRKASAVIPLLWLAQKQEGWVSEPAIRDIANRLGMPYIRVYEVATFYTMFNLEPVGELPEFHPQVLDSLRQPLETGEIAVVRANARVVYPARFQLIAAMNPCRCGWAGENGEACARGPKCAQGYQARVSGPMMDRIDLQIDVPPVTPADLALHPAAEGTREVAARVARAREVQMARGGLNARLSGDTLDRVCAPDAPGKALLAQAAEAMGLTARSYHRILRTARTIADLDGADGIRRIHIAEALSARRVRTTGQKVSAPARRLAAGGPPAR